MINKLKELWALIIFIISVLKKIWIDYFLTNRGYVRSIIKFFPLKYSREFLRICRRKSVKITSLSNFEFEVLLNSLNNSSTKNQILLNTYITFLLLCIVYTTSISAKDIFLNTGFRFFTFDITLTVYEFSIYTPILILFLHIFLIESLLEHYRKVYSFCKYSFQSKNIQEKLLYLNPFSFNHISLYSKYQFKYTSFKLFIFFQILMFLPIILLIQICLISSYPIISLFFILIIGMVNIILSFRIYSNAITFIPYYFLMVGFVFYAAFETFKPMQIQNYMLVNKIDSKNINYQKLFPLNYINDVDLTPVKHSINEKNYVEGLYVNDRDIKRVILRRVKLGNSVFTNTDFNSVKFDKTILTNNRFYNTDFNFVDFNASFFNKIKMIGEYSDYFKLINRRNTSKIMNSNFYMTNIIDSKFQHLTFKNVSFYKNNIINSEFNKNKNQEFFILGGTVISTIFSSSDFGLKDKQYKSKIKELKNQEYYKKLEKNQDFSEKDRKERINRLKLNLKEKVFDRVTFVDTIFNNVTFKNCKIENIIFNNVTFRNSKFENCLFKFKTKEDFVLSKLLFQKIDSTKTNVLMIDNKVVKYNFL